MKELKVGECFNYCGKKFTVIEDNTGNCHDGASVFTCPLNWRKIEISYVHELQHILFGLKLNSEMEI